MLPLAIEAKLPLVAVRTDDPVNVGAVLEVTAGKKAIVYMPNLKTKVQTGSLYYSVDNESLDLRKEYQKFSAVQSTLVLVNPKEMHPATFDAGVLVTPPEMIERFVQKYGSPEQHDGLVAALSGLSYEQVFQISKMAMAKHGEYSPRAVRDIRRAYFGTVRGLQMLSTGFFYYQPDPTLQDWLKTSGRFLTEFEVPLLTPRGLLFNGPPGTGKTMGAKYLAQKLDLPLYHLDIASMMGKYVGESEHNLSLALRQAEVSAPCVLLLDEVEKLFTAGGSDDSGVTTRMLSSILWWLQEHKSKVFTIMTTNKETAIPPELYRPGRIDREIKFKLLDADEAYKFETALAKRMGDSLGLPWQHLLGELDTPCSHAAVTQRIVQRAKLAFLKQEV